MLNKVCNSCKGKLSHLTETTLRNLSNSTGDDNRLHAYLH